MSTKLELKNSYNINNNNYETTNKTEKPSQQLEDKVESAKYRQIFKPENRTDRFLYSKREILVYMKNRAQQKMSLKPSLEKTMTKIIERCERKIQLLDKGIDVKIPIYYHVTKENAAISILHTSILSQEANNGKGAYLSTDIEPQFGDFALAFDREDVESEKLAPNSLVNKRELWVSGSLSSRATWRALENDFPVFDSHDKVARVAYVAVKNEKDIPKLKNIQNETGPFEIVSYEEAQEELKMIAELQGVYEPKSWNPHIDNAMDSLSSKFEFKGKVTKTSSPEEDQEWA